MKSRREAEDRAQGPQGRERRAWPRERVDDGSRVVPGGRSSNVRAEFAFSPPLLHPSFHFKTLLCGERGLGQEAKERDRSWSQSWRRER